MKNRKFYKINSGWSKHSVSFDIISSNNKINIDFMPKGRGGVGGGAYDFGIKDKAKKNIISNIQKCKSVDKLASLLINSVDFSYVDIEEYGIDTRDLDKRKLTYNEDLLAKLDDFVSSHDNNYNKNTLAIEVLNKVKKFRDEFSTINNIKDITVVQIDEYYYGMRELAIRAAINFREDAITEDIDWDNKKEVMESLKDRFTEKDIKLLWYADDMEIFDSHIVTNIYLAEDKVEKKYIIDGEIL